MAGREQIAAHQDEGEAEGSRRSRATPLGLRYATLHPGRGMAQARPDRIAAGLAYERAAFHRGAGEQTVIREAVAAQAVEDEACPLCRMQEKGLYHRSMRS